MINNVTLVGRTTKAIELKYTELKTPYTRFIIAVKRPYTNQEGGYETDFINCIAWGKQAENIAKYVSKGSMIGIEGAIQTGHYMDNEGIKRKTFEVVVHKVSFLDPKKNNDKSKDEAGNGMVINNTEYSYGQISSPRKPNYEAGIDKDRLLEDELPF